MARKDKNGRNLKTGEYYDSKNKRYMFRKMINGERVTISADALPDLRAQENELLCRIDRGNVLNTRNSRMLLNEYFDFWLETFGRSGRKATTCTNYKSYYQTYIRNTIGKRPIGKITKADCQKIINEMIRDGKKRSTMANLKSCLNVVFESALDDDIILKNPAKNLEIPQTETVKREAVDEKEVALFMEYVRNNGRYSYAYPAFVTLFNLGLRVGEMAALTWKDINFKAGTVSITKTINRYRKTDYGFTMGAASPKSKTSVRIITMNSIVKTTLLKLKMLNRTAASELPLLDDSGNVRGKVSGFIFANSYGRVWNEPSFLELINRIIERYNREAEEKNAEPLHSFCPHMARHTFTSLAYAAGIDVKVVSDTLGHASTAVTLDTYTHLTEEKKRQQAALKEGICVL